MGVMYYKDENGKVYPVNKGPRGRIGPSGGAEDVAEHEAKSNPHGQYLTADDVVLREPATEPPADLVPNAVLGASIKYAREDHAHARPTPEEIGALSTEGGVLTGNLSLPSFDSGASPVLVGSALDMQSNEIINAADPTTPQSLATRAYTDGLVKSAMPTGSIVTFAGGIGVFPEGWLWANGQAVSRTDYADLFAVIGTTYGVGDGSTTFNVPNLQGRAPVGYDGSQAEFNGLGKTGGAKTHALTTNEMPSHSHPWVQPNTTAASNYAGSGGLQGDQTTTRAAIGNTGGGAAHNNLQPYIALHYLIKA